MSKDLLASPVSPFDSIRHIRPDGSEYWSARELQPLLGYAQWRQFEDAIQRAMIACKNSGYDPHRQVADARNLLKRGKYATQDQTDYHLSRYACYLVAMNSDPRKTEVSAAQSYFAIKTRQAELAQTPRIHCLTDQMRSRALENLAHAPAGYFSVMGELFKHLYNLEALLNSALDEEAMIEISVAQTWSSYARDVLHLPDHARRKYPHVLATGRIVKVWAYPRYYETAFVVWLWEVYFPEHFAAYQQYHARYLTHAPRRRVLR